METGGPVTRSKAKQGGAVTPSAAPSTHKKAATRSTRKTNAHKGSTTPFKDVSNEPDDTVAGFDVAATSAQQEPEGSTGDTTETSTDAQVPPTVAVAAARLAGHAASSSSAPSTASIAAIPGLTPLPTAMGFPGYSGNTPATGMPSAIQPVKLDSLWSPHAPSTVKQAQVGSPASRPFAGGSSSVASGIQQQASDPSSLDLAAMFISTPASAAMAATSPIKGLVQHEQQAQAATAANTSAAIADNADTAVVLTSPIQPFAGFAAGVGAAEADDSKMTAGEQLPAVAFGSPTAVADMVSEDIPSGTVDDAAPSAPPMPFSPAAVSSITASPAAAAPVSPGSQSAGAEAITADGIAATLAKDPNHSTPKHSTRLSAAAAAAISAAAAAIGTPVKSPALGIPKRSPRLSAAASSPMPSSAFSPFPDDDDDMPPADDIYSDKEAMIIEAAAQGLMLLPDNKGTVEISSGVVERMSNGADENPVETAASITQQGMNEDVVTGAGPVAQQAVEQKKDVSVEQSAADSGSATDVASAMDEDTDKQNAEAGDANLAAVAGSLDESTAASEGMVSAETAEADLVAAAQADMQGVLYAEQQEAAETIAAPALAAAAQADDSQVLPGDAVADNAEVQQQLVSDALEQPHSQNETIASEDIPAASNSDAVDNSAPAAAGSDGLDEPTVFTPSKVSSGVITPGRSSAAAVTPAPPTPIAAAGATPAAAAAEGNCFDPASPDMLSGMQSAAATGSRYTGACAPNSAMARPQSTTDTKAQHKSAVVVVPEPSQSKSVSAKPPSLGVSTRRSGAEVGCSSSNLASAGSSPGHTPYPSKAKIKAATVAAECANSIGSGTAGKAAAGGVSSTAASYKKEIGYARAHSALKQYSTATKAGSTEINAATADSPEQTELGSPATKIAAAESGTGGNRPGTLSPAATGRGSSSSAHRVMSSRLYQPTASFKAKTRNTMTPEVDTGVWAPPAGAGVVTAAASAPSATSDAAGYTGRRLASKVVVPSPPSAKAAEPSLKALRRSIKEKTEKRAQVTLQQERSRMESEKVLDVNEVRGSKKASAGKCEAPAAVAEPHDDLEYDESEDIGDSWPDNDQAADALADSMAGLSVSQLRIHKPAGPLKGMAAPSGKHIVFDDDCKPNETPLSKMRAGPKKTYFDEDGNPIPAAPPAARRWR